MHAMTTLPLRSRTSLEWRCRSGTDLRSAHLRFRQYELLRLYCDSLTVTFRFARVQFTAIYLPKHCIERYSKAAACISSFHDGSAHVWWVTSSAHWRTPRRRICIYDGCIIAQSRVTCASCQNILELQACKWSGLPDLDATSLAIGLW